MKNKHIGSINKMKNGLNACCIEYRSYSDIDIQFEDGIIVKKKSFGSFKKGEIKHPSINSIIKKSSCLNETRKMRNGQNATCIAYRNSKDIDIKFEDGTIIKHKSKRPFYQGRIGNPSIGRRITSHKSIKGSKKMMNCGLFAIVIDDRNASDIDVQFEDGAIVRHSERASFLKGEIGHPDYEIKSLPQQIIYYCVKKYYSDAVINYRPVWLRNENTNRSLEIDIWIPSIKVGIEYDGYPWHKKDNNLSLLKNNLIEQSDEIKCLYSFIEKDCIVHYGKKHHNFLLSYHSNNDNILKSEYYKEIEKCINDMFVSIGINETIIIDDELLDKVRKNRINSWLGESKMMKNGQFATIIAYRAYNMIDVQFEDGTIVTNRRKSAFKSREILNPNLKSANELAREKYTNMTLKMRNGLNATIVEYRNSSDVDILYEDGVLMHHKNISNFLNGRISNPNVSNYDVLRKSILGERRMMNCGMNATCIAYRKTQDIDVQFDDGTIVEHKTKQNFYLGKITNPSMKGKSDDYISKHKG